MKGLCRIIVVVGTSLVLFTSVAFPKVALSKLFISGGKLPQPVEVTNPQLLQASNPWFGSFIPAWTEISERVAEPPQTAPRYEIAFYARFSPKEAPHIIYVGYYAFDPASRRGFIYLPGRSEQWYRTNVSSIIRPHEDGQWNLANPSWCDQVNLIIAHFEHN
jgi:hypothetical protein